MAMEATEFAFPMDAEECEEGYDREYVADDFARYFRAFITSGIIADGGNIAEGLQVVANDDMTTTLKAGNLIIDGYRYELMKDMVFQHRAADGVLDRIDRISITLDTAEREIHAILREGEYSYKPVAPQCRRTSEYMDYVVADVRIVKGATKIEQANITDTRLSTELCGIAFPFWKLDTGPFFAQLNSFYDEFVLKSDRSYDEFLAWAEEKKAEITTWQGEEQAETDTWQAEKKEGFDEWVQEFVNKWESWLLGETKGWQEEIIDWFDNLKEKLSENAAVQLQQQIGELKKLETDEKENLVSAINSLCLSYDETMKILLGGGNVSVTLTTQDGTSFVEQVTVTLLDTDTGEEVSKDYKEGGISFELSLDTQYLLSVRGLEDYHTPDPVEVYINSDEKERELKVDFWCEIKSFSDISWAKVSQISAIGKAQIIFYVGAKKDFTLTTGEKVKAVILDFDRDPLTEDTTKTAGITFGMLNCLATKYRMNDTANNGYKLSELSAKVTTEFYDKLPADMKPYLKKVNKFYTTGALDDTPFLTRTLETYAFPLAQVEVVGDTLATCDVEGEKYRYFNSSRRIKTLGESGEPVDWWLRSITSGSSAHSGSVTSQGTISYEYCTTKLGLSVCFCI